MKKTIYEKEKKRKHRFLVGFVGDGQVVYDMRDNTTKGKRWVEPLTLLQAKRALKKLNKARGDKYAIYEVVPYAIFKD